MFTVGVKYAHIVNIAYIPPPLPGCMCNPELRSTSRSKPLTPPLRSYLCGYGGLVVLPGQERYGIGTLTRALPSGRARLAESRQTINSCQSRDFYAQKLDKFFHHGEGCLITQNAPVTPVAHAAETDQNPSHGLRVQESPAGLSRAAEYRSNP